MSGGGGGEEEEGGGEGEGRGNSLSSQQVIDSQIDVLNIQYLQLYSRFFFRKW